MATTLGQGADLIAAAGMDPKAVYAALATGPGGLSAEEAHRRLTTHGANELPPAKKVPFGLRFLRQFQNLFNVLLLFATALSFFVGAVFGDPSSLQMGWVILGVVLFNSAFSVGQEYRAEHTVEALRRMIPANAKVVRGGSLIELPVAVLVPGDVIELEQGEKVPADARLISAFALTVDHSTLTGESDPLPRSTEARPAGTGNDVTDATNVVFAGTNVVSGSGTAVVVATGVRTRFGQIVARTQEVPEEPSPLQREIDRFARSDFAVAIAVALIFLALAVLWRGLGALAALLFMIGVAIDLVPEGFQLTVTLALAFSSVSMARRNVVAKQLASVETLGSTTVICTDKTGTVTTGQMTVREAWLGGESYSVTGEGFSPEGDLRRGETRVRLPDSPVLRRACEVAALNNQASLVPPLDRAGRRWSAVGDTTEAALLAFAIKADVKPKQLLLGSPRIGLVPFDSTRKMMTSIHRTPEGVVAYTKGAGREVLERCATRLTAERTEPLTEAYRAEVLERMDAFARRAYRVLALALRPLVRDPGEKGAASVERDLVFVGLVAIQDPPRAETPDAVRAARDAGLRVFMLTGDHELTAEAIARQVGLLSAESQPVVSGARLAGMSDRELASVIEAPEAVFARITPEQKHRIVRALKAQGEIVAVTGDGANDAPALAEADIGIAMGVTGTDVAREAADMVLVDDNFASIVKGVEVGRGVFDNLRRFVTYVFTHNWAELVSFVAFVLLGVPLAITVLYVISIDLMMEIPISLALTLEPPGRHIMERPPRAYGSRLFDRQAIMVSAYLGNLLGIGALLAGFAVWSQGGWSYGMSVVPDAAAFVRGATVVVAGIELGQVGNFLARRADPASAFSLSPRRNRWFFPGVLATLGLLVLLVYAPPLQALFGTAPLRLEDWFLVLPFVGLTLLVEEVRMAAWRRISPAPAPAPRRPVPVPAAGVAVPRTAAGEDARRSVPPWAQRPVILPVFLRPADRAAAIAALRIAALGGSQIVVVPIHRGGDPRRLADREQAIARLAAEAGVTVEFVRFARADMPSHPPDIAHAIVQIADRHGAGAIVLPADPDRFSRQPLGRVAPYLAASTKVHVVLVRTPAAAEEPWPPLTRILIPVLEAFHPEPFEVADLLGAVRAVPDVGIVVARVVRIPPIVPLYATYTPESLVDVEKETSVLGRLMRGRTRGGEPRILLVRDVSRDLRDFAQERDVDAIVLWGDRRGAPRFVSRSELGLVGDPPCTVLVVLPGREEADPEGRDLR